MHAAETNYGNTGNGNLCDLLWRVPAYGFLYRSRNCCFLYRLFAACFEHSSSRGFGLPLKITDISLSPPCHKTLNL